MVTHCSCNFSSGVLIENLGNLYNVSCILGKLETFYLATLESLRKPSQCNFGNLENLYHVTLGTLRTFTWKPWEP